MHHKLRYEGAARLLAVGLLPTQDAGPAAEAEGIFRTLVAPQRAEHAQPGVGGRHAERGAGPDAVRAALRAALSARWTAWRGGT